QPYVYVLFLHDALPIFKSYKADAALKVPGVLKVVEIPAGPIPPVFAALGGVAVVAADTWAAMKGRSALEIEWDDGPNASYDSERSEEHTSELQSRENLV